MTSDPGLDRLRPVYEEIHTRLWRAVLAWSGSTYVADEAVAEAFAQAAGRGAAIDNPAAWIWRSAFRIAAGELARRRQHDRRFWSLDAAGGDLAGAEALPPGDAVDLIRALQQLSDQQRRAIVLVDGAGFTAPEAATLLETSPATIRVQLVRARRRLRTLLVDQEGGTMSSDRFRPLGQLTPPEQWDEIRARATGADGVARPEISPAPDRSRRRATSIALAAAVVVALGIAGMVGNRPDRQVAAVGQAVTGGDCRFEVAGDDVPLLTGGPPPTPLLENVGSFEGFIVQPSRAWARLGKQTVEVSSPTFAVIDSIGRQERAQVHGGDANVWYHEPAVTVQWQEADAERPATCQSFSIGVTGPDEEANRELALRLADAVVAFALPDSAPSGGSAPSSPPPPDETTPAGALDGALADQTPFRLRHDPDRGLCVAFGEVEQGCDDDPSIFPPGAVASVPRFVSDPCCPGLFYGLLPSSSHTVFIAPPGGERSADYLVVDRSTGMWAIPLPAELWTAEPSDSSAVDVFYLGRDGVIPAPTR